jgi:hypothetical protein
MYIEESINFEDFIWKNKIFFNIPKYFSFSFTQINSLKNMKISTFVIYVICVEATKVLPYLKNGIHLVQDYAM